MGIKFQCPEGHPLNVKSFLAGKRGICPQCQTKFVIPTASGGKALPAPSKLEPNALEITSAPSSDVVPSPPAPLNAAATPAQRATGHAAAGLPQAMPAQPIAAPAMQETLEATPADAPAAHANFAAPTLHDPIDEAPQALWYVRPPSGGQFGPAVGEIMRNWIDEGRVSGDSLVWREGWQDWRPAASVLPQLATDAESAGGRMPFDAAVADSSIPASTAANYRVRRRRSNRMTLMLVALMALIAIGLLVVFFWVLSRRNPPPDATVDRQSYQIETLARSRQAGGSGYGLKTEFPGAGNCCIPPAST